jgi:hypothetical protein
MASIKTIAVEIEGTRDLVLVAEDDSIWLVVPLRWWDLSTILWWLLIPANRKANITITTDKAQKVSLRAVHIASRWIRVRGSYLKKPI